MEDHEKKASLIDAVIASLKRKFGTLSPPVPVAEELHALQNVSTKLRDPDAEIVEHKAFVPSTGGMNSTVDTVIPFREGVPITYDDDKGNADSLATLETPGAGEAAVTGLGGPKDVQPDEPVAEAARSGHDLNINAGPKEPPVEV